MAEVVVVGTRSERREPLESPVPVKLVIGEMLRNSGHVETGRALQMLAPSFNFQSSAITDGTDSVRPVMLRGAGREQCPIKLSGVASPHCTMRCFLSAILRRSTDLDSRAAAIRWRSRRSQHLVGLGPWATLGEDHNFGDLATMPARDYLALESLGCRLEPCRHDSGQGVPW